MTMERFSKGSLWVYGAFVVFGIIVNFGGFIDMVGDLFRMCFWPGLIAVGIVAVVVAAVGRR